MTKELDNILNISEKNPPLWYRVMEGGWWQEKAMWPRSLHWCFEQWRGGRERVVADKKDRVLSDRGDKKEPSARVLSDGGDDDRQRGGG